MRPRYRIWQIRLLEWLVILTVIGARIPITFVPIAEGIVGTPCTVPMIAAVDLSALSTAINPGSSLRPSSTNDVGVLSGIDSKTPSGSSIVRTVSFQGLSQHPNTIAGVPDVILAVGPRHIVEMVNFEVGVWEKSGAPVRTLPLSELFSSGEDRVFDPSILFDSQTGKWFATVADFEKGSVLLAVSTTDSPTGVWGIYIIDATVVTPGIRSVFTIPDVPMIGTSSDKFAVAVDSILLGSNSAGGRFWILNKDQLVRHFETVDCSSFGPDRSLNWMHPAHSLSPTFLQYLVSLGPSSGTARTATVISITGVPPGHVSATYANLTLSPAADAPPDAIQPKTTIPLNTKEVGTRVQSVAWYLGSLWFGLHQGCVPLGDTFERSCLRLVEVETTKSPLKSRQSFVVGTSGGYNFYPALTIDRRGSVAVVFGFSSNTDYPGVGVTGHFANDPLDSWVNPLLIINGSSTNQNLRYGDYFGAAVDPADPYTVWVSGEYMPPSYGSVPLWSSVIAGLHVEPSP